MTESTRLSPERLGILQKLAAAIQQGEHMAQEAKREAEEFLKMCAADLGLDYPTTFEFQGDRFVPRRPNEP